MGRTLSLTKTAKKSSARKPKAIGLEDAQVLKTRGEEIAEKVQRLHVITAQCKELEREKDALKEWFKAEAAGKDQIFEFMDQQVLATNKERSGWDGDALMQKLGAEAERFRKTTQYVEVAVRMKPAA